MVPVTDEALIAKFGVYETATQKVVNKVGIKNIPSKINFYTIYLFSFSLLGSRRIISGSGCHPRTKREYGIHIYGVDRAIHSYCA